MALEGFKVSRPITGRAGTATSARASLTTTGVSTVTLAGRAATATSARGLLGVTVRYTGRAATATSARGSLSLFGAVPPPGVFAVLRNRVAVMLAGLDADWEVHALPVDAIDAPAFILEWGDPWTEPGTHCVDLAHLEVVCVASRVEPDTGVETLELMVEAALAAFNRAGLAHAVTSPPRPLEVGGLAYLAARIQVHDHVTIGG